MVQLVQSASEAGDERSAAAELSVLTSAARVRIGSAAQNIGVIQATSDLIMLDGTPRSKLKTS
jgi:hypothetical protein